MDTVHGLFLAFASQPSPAIHIFPYYGTDAERRVWQPKQSPAGVELTVQAIIKSSYVVCPKEALGIAAAGGQLHAQSVTCPNCPQHRQRSVWDGYGCPIRPNG